MIRSIFAVMPDTALSAKIMHSLSVTYAVSLIFSFAHNIYPPLMFTMLLCNYTISAYSIIFSAFQTRSRIFVCRLNAFITLFEKDRRNHLPQWQMSRRLQAILICKSISFAMRFKMATCGIFFGVIMQLYLTVS